MERLKHLMVAGLISMLMACMGESGISQESSDSPNNSQSSIQSIDFNYDIQALFQQSLTVSGRSLTSHGGRAFSSDQIMLGTLSVSPYAGGESQLFSWTVYLDQDNWQAQSNISIELEPGQYDFALLLEDDDGQYVATTRHTVEDGKNDVAMTIRPVMGDVLVVTQIEDAHALVDYKFQYAVEDLAQISEPKIGITINEQPQQIFIINKQSGMPDSYLNLQPGEHDIQLALYDGNVQIARSRASQEQQTIINGQDVVMDLVPLHAETQLILSAQGGDASVSIQIPQLLADEVGGINNLLLKFSAVGEENPLQQIQPQFSAMEDGYQADFSLNDLQFDQMTMSLVFEERDSGEQIAVCNNVWSINSLSQTINCELEVRRRRIIGGSLLAVLGINVLNDLHEPMAGAVIKDQDGNILGITGSGEWGTAGYLKFYLEAGDYSIIANHIASNKSASTSLTLQALAIENLTLTLDSPYDFPVGPAAQNKITSAMAHSCAIDNQMVSCWGGNLFSQTDVPPLNRPSQVWSSDVSSCAMTDDGMVCWGGLRSGYGRVPQELTGISQLSFGTQASCALSNHEVHCWGNNSFGQKSIPDELEFALDIAVGSRHVCAIADSGQVSCWGDNFFDQLEIPDDLENVKSIYSGGFDSCAVTDEDVLCWGGNAHGQNDFEVDMDTFTTLAMGILNTCIVEDEEAKCFGYGGYGVNDVPEDLGKVSNLSVSNSYACAITENGVRCWGEDYFGETQPPAN
mgnify:CR=1 FL=1